MQEKVEYLEEVAREGTCPMCNGDGLEGGVQIDDFITPTTTCYFCSGSGLVRYVVVECKNCQGAGCDACQETGRVKRRVE